MSEQNRYLVLKYSVEIKACACREDQTIELDANNEADVWGYFLCDLYERFSSGNSEQILIKQSNTDVMSIELTDDAFDNTNLYSIKSDKGIINEIVDSLMAYERQEFSFRELEISKHIMQGEDDEYDA